jgi:iron complex outermembrane recepter protein
MHVATGGRFHERDEFVTRRAARMRHASVWLPGLLLGISCGAADGPPDPQDRGDELSEIVVTGSRIRRADDDRLEPTLVIDSRYLEDRGITNVLDALKELPNVSSLGNSLQGGQSTFGIGQSFVNLYTLGSNRSLTLVDGRRFVSGNSASIYGPTGTGGGEIDLNVIPTQIVDRIEVTSVGGTPVYGSDAIAGTVNILLKHDYQGFQVDALGGIAQKGDASESRVRFLAGKNFGDGRGNLEMSAELVNTPGLLSQQRAPYSYGNNFLNPVGSSPYQYVLYPNVVLGGTSRSGVPTTADVYANSSSPYSIRNAAGQVLAFSQGHLVPWTYGPASGISNVGGDGYGVDWNYVLAAPQERINGTMLGRLDINDHVRLFGELWFSETHTSIAAQDDDFDWALGNGAGLPNGNLIISATNPFLSAADQATIARNLAAFAATAGNPPQTRSFYLSRVNDDIDNGEATADQNTKRAVLGLEGPIAGFTDLHYEISGNYGRLVNQNATPSVNYQNFFNALNAVRGPNGTIVCAPGQVNSPVATESGTCAPFNPFGYDIASAAAKAYVTTLAESASINTQRIFTTSLDGTLLKLPTGAMKFAMGYENRRETAEFDPDSFYQEAAGQFSVIPPTAGAFHTNEVFGELEVPVLEPGMGLPGAHRFEVEGAIRDIDHSIAGKTIAWTAGLRFEPVAAFMFRGNYTRSVRAPTITEAFSATTLSYETPADPCDALNVNGGPDPKVRAANCAAAGIKQPFVSNSATLGTLALYAGNPNLLNEVANSRSFGFVARPKEGLSLQVDYVGIDLKQAIQELNAAQVLEACYDDPDYHNGYCSRVTRQADGQLQEVAAGFFNEAHLTFNGVSSRLDYGFPVPFAAVPGHYGDLHLRLDYFFNNHSSLNVGETDYLQLPGSVDNPRHQATASIRWSKGAVFGFWETQFIEHGSFDQGLAPNFANYPGVSDWFVHNLMLGCAPDEHFRVQLMIQNVFDRQPPVPLPIAPPTNFEFNGEARYFSGLMGRHFQIFASYRL